MAKKPTFSELYGRWSQQKAGANRRRDEMYTNREQEALGIIQSIEKDGTALSDDQKADILNQVVRTGEFTFADTPVLPAPAMGVDTAEDVNPATGRPYPEARAISTEDAFDNIPTRLSQATGDFGARLRAGAREGLAGLMTGVAPVVNLIVRC